MKIPRFLQIAALIMLAAGAQPAYSAFWQWSKTAATNAGADPTINWAEGMSPSSVNDSARAMMARQAEYRDDISGLLATGGTSAAYTVATNQGLCTTTGATAPNDGQLLSVTVNAANANAATLTADGCNAAPIRIGPGTPIPAATLLNGNPYSLKYSVANTAWMVRGFYGSPLSIPLGGLVPYTLSTVPNSNFVFPAGQCLSTTTYAAYWVAKGSPASGSCPGGQFQIIDLSGRFLAGMDPMPGFAATGRLTSASTGCGTDMSVVGQVCANGNQSVQLTAAMIPDISVGVSVGVSVSGSISGSAGPLVIGGNGIAANAGNGFASGNAGVTGSFSGSGSGTGSGSSTNTGGGLSPNVPPTIGVAYLLRVL